jgi:hypothetical protein
MKTNYFILFFLFFSLIVGTTCKKSNKCEDGPFFKGYIIGFDPCTAKSSDSVKGYVIKFENNPDTVVAYFSLPSNINIPNYLFDGFMDDFLFPDGYRDKYIIEANYRTAKPSEVVILFCYSPVSYGAFHSTTKGRQTVIDCFK